MIDPAARFAFAGNAFLKPEPARLAELARELEDEVLAAEIERDPEGLEKEYYRLFLNPQGTPCPPWQSVHGEEKRLMGESHLQALEWFRRYGVEPASANEPADHIGLLLLFYAKLLESGAEEAELAAFRAAHLAWIPAFCDSLEAQAKHPFYAGLARETRALIADASGLG